MGTEFQGEADFGIILAPQSDFHPFFKGIRIFGLKTKTAIYVARTARNELFFIGFCRERRREADSPLGFVSLCLT